MSHPPSSSHQSSDHSLRETASPTSTGTRSTRAAAQSAWSNPSTVRQPPRSPGLAAINTVGALSPTTSGSPHSAVRQSYSRQSSASSSQSVTSPPASGHYAPGSLHSGQRSRAVTGSGSPRPATSLTSSGSLSQGGGTGGIGGGGGSSRLVRHSPSVSISTVVSPISSSGGGSGGGQITSLVSTQLNILLSTLRESNFDTQAEKIRRLLDENGMELFETYFRRLLNASWPLVFPHTSKAGPATPNAESHRLLEQEVRKLSTEPQQAEQVARALDTPDYDADLAAFAEHFHLDPVSRVALALPCRSATNSGLRAKGMSRLHSLCCD